MAKLIWDQTGQRFYETGVKKGVLYVQNTDGSYGTGVVWNGLTAVTQSPSGAEATPLYADDTKYVEMMSNEDFGGTIEAYTYPDEFAACDGSASLATGVTVAQQARKTFGFSYVTTVGNDTAGNDFGYKIHIVYGAKASPSEKAYATINDSPEAITFSWEFSTTPVAVGEGFKPTSHIEIDSTKVNNAAKMAELEALLWGGEGETANPKLPTPAEIKAIFEEA